MCCCCCCFPCDSRHDASAEDLSRLLPLRSESDDLTSSVVDQSRNDVVTYSDGGGNLSSAYIMASTYLQRPGTLEEAALLFSISDPHLRKATADGWRFSEERRKKLLRSNSAAQSDFLRSTRGPVSNAHGAQWRGWMEMPWGHSNCDASQRQLGYEVVDTMEGDFVEQQSADQAITNGRSR